MSANEDPDWLTHLKPGQRVVAESDRVEVGEVVRVELAGPTPWVQVQRYGAGLDELYIPLTAIDRVVGNHVYLRIHAADLLGQPWHVPPVSS